jgi:BA14K-like protein
MLRCRNFVRPNLKQGRRFWIITRLKGRSALIVLIDLRDRMHRFLAFLIVLMWSAASAQTTGTLPPASAGAPPKAETPPGSCMPIGLTASGELVFPIQCEGIIERARGAKVDQKPANPEKPPTTGRPEKANNSEQDATAKSEPPAISSPITKPAESSPITKPAESVSITKPPEKTPKPKIRDAATSNDAPGCKSFRSYQPGSKTYRDFDGKRRPCL